MSGFALLLTMGIPRGVYHQEIHVHMILCGLQKVKFSNEKNTYPLPRIDDTLDQL